VRLIVAAIPRRIAGDGPSRICGATHRLIKETAVLVFGNYLDATLGTPPAEGEGSARSNAGIIQLIVTPIVLIHRGQVQVTNFEAGIIYYRIPAIAGRAGRLPATVVRTLNVSTSAIDQ
jgi:hypothetical protein